MRESAMCKLSVIFFIFDDINRFSDSFVLNLNTSDEQSESQREIKAYKPKKEFLSVFRVDGYFLSVFRRLIELSQVYSKMVYNNLVNTVNDVPVGDDISIKFELVEPKVEVLDYAWNNRIVNLILEHQELDHAMSWLSTLGGAFSALGDDFQNCAKIAGKISIQQFKIAFQRGEPPLVARCRLYMALSLIQLGKLSTARSMIKKQYEVALSYKDIRLQNMCKGVWAKLQYMYEKKKKLL